MELKEPWHDAIQNFVSSADSRYPYLFEDSRLAKQTVSSDYAVLEYDCGAVLDIGETVEWILRQMELRLLYYHARSEATDYGWSCCAYCRPALGLYYKINAETDGSGRVSHFTVTMYRTAEYLCGELGLELENKSTSGAFRQNIGSAQIMADFCTR